MLMEIAIFFVRLLLVGIFILAGVSKLADLAGTRQAALDFGITAALIVPFAILLPLIEIAIAVLLVIPRTVWCGAICSAVLLLGFLVVIGIHLARGRKPPCHCFGKLHSEPIGPPTVLRNLMLLCVALFLTLVGPTAVNHHLAASVDAFSFITEYAPFYILALFAFSAVQTFLVFQLIRQNGRLLLRVDTLEAERSEPVAEAGMPVGIPAPHFELLDMDGTLVSSGSLLRGGLPVLLVFVDPGCGHCATLLPDLVHWQRTYPDYFSLAIISAGTAEVNRAKLGGAEIAPVLLQRAAEVRAAYDVPATPGALIVYPDGRIATPVTVGPTAIRELVLSFIEAWEEAKDQSPQTSFPDENARLSARAALQLS